MARFNIYRAVYLLTPLLIAFAWLAPTVFAQTTEKGQAENRPVLVRVLQNKGIPAV